MWKLELTCLVIVALFVGVRARLDPEPKRFFRRLFLIFGAAWLAEDSVIHAYGFYGYSPDWTVFIDRVPLMVLLIWPVVIHSAWDLSRNLFGYDNPKTPLIAGLFVLADASMIEPIAVESGLWFWTEPGMFMVPPIGILGWSIFAVWALTLIERRALAALVVLAPALGTHVVLLLLWWSFFRWFNRPLPDGAVAAVAWCLSLVATYLAIRSRASSRVPLIEMVLRMPAALFFFVLLGLYCLDVPALVIYALAFVPPYLAITPIFRRRH